jgi:hypothetical protein
MAAMARTGLGETVGAKRTAALNGGVIMVSTRPRNGQSAADTVAAARTAHPLRGARRRSMLGYGMLMAALTLFGATSSASALIITGGPTYTLPGGGSCSMGGVASATGGATISCTGVNLAAHTKVYFGIRNASNVNGNTMTGSAPTASSPAVFRYLSNTGTAITYSSATTINDTLNGPQNVTNRLLLTSTAGTATVVAAGGTPANNGNGDIQAVFQVGSASFTVRADVQASNAIFPTLGVNAIPNVYDPTRTASGAGPQEISIVDVAFYYSDCGDGIIDSPEQCDEGSGVNGSASSCCTATCDFRPAVEVCRPGAGTPCDANETCTGASAICPSDDAPINLGVVCRGGSGDVCDENETCTGVPGAGCPADDALAKVGLVCRVGSVGDICDENETCTGSPGATCPPDDAPGKINLICRPGSGDICDPEERCTGLSGQGCPPNVVSNPTTVCRVGSGDICDPTETCTAIPGQPCPSDGVASAGTQCRAAAGSCDVAEQCPGSAGQTCPNNGFAPSGTTCDADSSVCTNDECNGSNVCVFASNVDCEDGNACTQDTCDAQNGCVSTGQPSNTCASASRAQLKIKNSSPDTRDSVKFIWNGGPSLIADMGDPTQTTRYELCLYDSRGIQMAMGVPPGAGWATVGLPSSPKGYKYKDIAAQSDGIKQIKTKASNLDKAKVSVVGKGLQLPDTAALPLQYPITAQVYASDGMCWQAQFGGAETRKNDAEKFSAKTPP